MSNKITTVVWPVKAGISFAFNVILKQVQENAIHQYVLEYFSGQQRIFSCGKYLWHNIQQDF
jgi:hypothetical protein